jgi:amino acid adenylation domain-containing protein
VSGNDTIAEENASDALASDAIAIVGISGRFPGAANLDQFWDNIRNGVCSVTRFSDDELEDAHPPEVRNDPKFVKARPIIEGVDQFDAGFFGMLAREAASTDPQHRLFLECAWEALEDGGVDPSRYDGAIGVFAGAAFSTYMTTHVVQDRATMERAASTYQLGDFSIWSSGLQDFLATRTAYKLNLRGPAINVQSACSTSLLAVAQGCQSLQLYQSDMALAGGVSISFPMKRGYLFQEEGIVAPDGICRPFDANGAGTVFGMGAGVVLLKRLEDALRDGNQIYAVIRAAAINNDGADKVGFTAPSVDGQAAVIATAQAVAGVDPESISYIECHGTATPLGDPIEFEGLRKAFGAETRQFCGLGSVKANVGHLDAAAGVAGLIKAALGLHHGEMPPMANYAAPNPRIDFANSPFYVVDKLKPWPRGATPRRAGVSSFGMGGTNVHLVLEEAPRVTAAETAQDGSPIILPLSARSDEALAQAKERLAAYLEATPARALNDVAFTLVEGRRAFPKRTVVAVRTREEAIARLRGTTAISTAADSAPIIFMFPGQGAQYPGMGRDLYEREPLFRDIIQKGAALLQRLSGLDLLKVLYDDTPPSEDAPHPIRSTLLAQPALFLIEYATARLWMSWGVQPTAMIGHSVGEFVAACLSGVIQFEDALTLIAARGRLMQDMPGGAMLSVRLGEADLRPYLGHTLDLAAINSPNLCVVSGTFEDVDALEKTLDAAGVVHRRLHTSHAFHSRMMAPVVEALAQEAAKIRFSAPSIPYVSSLTGDWIKPDEAREPHYWARHCREAVRFADGLVAVSKDAKPILIEVGPGRTLATLASQILGKGGAGALINSMPEATRTSADDITMAEAFGRVWAAGAAIDWSARRPLEGRRVSLPTYPFQRQSHFIEAPKHAHQAPQAQVISFPTPTLVAPPTYVPIQASNPEPVLMTMPSSEARLANFRAAITEILEDLSGESLEGADTNASFLELGFDSLLLGQVVQQLASKFGVKITFRQLVNDIPTVEALVAFLDATMPANAAPAAAAPAAPVAQTPMQMVAAPMMAQPMPIAGGMEGVFAAQMAAMQNLFAQQLAAMQGAPAAMPMAPVAAPAAPSAASAAVAPKAPAAPQTAPAAAGDDEDTTPQRFKQYLRGARPQAQQVTNAQRDFIETFVQQYTTRTPGSKSYTAENRQILADPRAANGFRAEWKEAVYPIVSPRSKGSKIWDVDGNEYVDLVNGFGQTMFGHAPDFVQEAVIEQTKAGFAIGPQAPLAGVVAKQIANMIGMERVTFCNTGSEAVMAAMRLARTVTGRNKIVVFNNDYHGQFDEVLVKPGGKRQGPKALPVTIGVPPESVANMIVLNYGAPESLDWIRANANDLAAVIVEPVQSRHPEIRPTEFLKELRVITEQSGSAFVFDEVVTGFRTHQGGMQALYGVRADMATYGKVLGGGMPVGILAGAPRFMDALDGGQWRYGDESVPEVAPTFFAGTFVRHPLVLAACHAVMKHMEEQGPSLQTKLAERCAALVERINADLARRSIATRAETFSSWFNINFAGEDRLGSLFYLYVRHLGVHIQEGFPCFLTTTHTDEDLEKVYRAFTQALDALQGAGILAPKEGAAAASAAVATAASPSESPLTEPQIEVWLASQMGDEASCAFNESLNVRFEGPLSTDALANAMKDVSLRHDAMRARFSRAGDRMIIVPDAVIDLPVIDVSNEADPEASLNAFMAQDAATPFDLINGPVMRGHLLKLSPQMHVLVFTGHHIVADGWSLNIIVDELSKSYGARLAGAKADLPKPLSYAQYATDQAARGATKAEIESYWLSQYKTVPALPELPYDRQHPVVKTFAGATYTDFVDANLYRAVKKAGAKQGCTLFATLLATLQVMMGRLANANDVVVAVPTAGQSLLDGEILVGHAVNFLPIRAAFDAQAPFATHLQNAKKQVLDAYEHQDFTFGTLVRKLGVKRDPNRLPLTEIQFNLERIADGVEFGGLKVAITPNPKAFSNFDIFWNVVESDDGLRIDCDFNTDVFDAATIQRWVGHYRAILSALAADMSLKVAELPMHGPSELNWLIDSLNDTRAGFPTDAFVHDLIAAQAAKTPDAIAAVCGGESITYAALDKRANQLARHFRKTAPGLGQRIAVATDRSIDMLATLIAVMKAGHTYVPLDATHPAARLRQTVEAADVAAIVCNNDIAATFAPTGVKIIRIDQDAVAIAQESESVIEPALGDPERAAYVIFTSGSTGVPKGVAVPHRAVVNFLLSMAKKPGFEASDVLVAVTTISFDIAGLELYLPLTKGGRVVIADRDVVRGGFGLVDLINNAGASVVQATPSLWRMLMEAGFKPRAGLKMLCGGEPLPRDLADALTATGAELWNMYGPTETTIWSSCARAENGKSITIGEPIDNTQLFILDANDQLAPIGGTGQLYIGGDGLALGYFKRDDLTAGAFRTVTLPGRAAQRLYNTGDVGRRLANGDIQLLGRSDHQVKLRGFRIELEDIETALRKAPGVNAAAVALRGGDTPRLVGYVVLNQGADIDAKQLTDTLAAQLPDYMVPTMWMKLDALPLTANGKLDRKALPEPDADAAIADRTIVAPRTPLETQIADVWRRVLGAGEIGVHDNLFFLGADSLHVFRITARLIEQGLHIEAKDLLRHPTVAEIAEIAATRTEAPPVAERAGAPSLRAFRGGARRGGASS